MEKPQTRQRVPTYIRVLLYMAILASTAALVSGDCTHWTYSGVDSAEYGDRVAGTTTAALISAGLSLVVGCLFFLSVRNQSLLLMFTGITVAAYTTIYLTGLVLGPVVESSQFGLLFLPAMAVMGLMVVVGKVVYERSGKWRSIGAMASSGVAAILGVIAIVVGVFANYDLCIGYFGVSCRDPRPINIIPFALIVGGAPPIFAACATWVTLLANKLQSRLS